MGIDSVRLQYINQNMKEYFSVLTIKELNELEKMINNSVLKEDFNKREALKEIALEKKERLLSKQLPSTTTSFLREEFANVLEDITEEQIKKSMQYYNDLGIDMNVLMKWCPISMNVTACYKIYKKLHNQGKTDLEISEVLTTNYQRAKEVEQESSPESSKEVLNEFATFIQTTEIKLKHSKTGTESYDKYIKRMINQNHEVIGKLA